MDVCLFVLTIYIYKIDSFNEWNKATKHNLIKLHFYLLSLAHCRVQQICAFLSKRFFVTGLGRCICVKYVSLSLDIF